MIRKSTTIARMLRKEMTEAETLVWGRLKNRGLCGIKFTRQYVIPFEEAGERRCFIADFYSAQYSLAIELDGRIHGSQEEYDTMRTQSLMRKGIRVIRFSNDDIVNGLELVLKNIMEIIGTLTHTPALTRHPSPSLRPERGRGAGGEGECATKQGASKMKATILRTAILFASALTLSAQVPQRINYQGKLVDTAGIAVNGMMNFYFALYTNQTVGSKMWEETQNSVVVDRGYYSVQLGINGFSGVDFKSRPYFLAIRVTNTSGVASTAPELTPRIALLPVPVALAASNAAKADDSTRFDAKTFQQVMDLLVPVGTINSFFGDQADATNGGARWLICDGRTIGSASSSADWKSASYSNLFIRLYRNAKGLPSDASSIAEATSKWNANQRIALPDLRGKFLRGYTTDTAIDPDAGMVGVRTNKMIEGTEMYGTLGSVQGDSTKMPNSKFYGNTSQDSHYHSVYVQVLGAVAHGGWNDGTADYIYSVGDRKDTTTYSHSHSLSIDSGGDFETRPKNMFVNYIIRY